MNTNKILSVITILFFCVMTASSQTSIVDGSVKMPPHPRILLLKGEEKALLKNINKDPYWKDIHNNYISEADKIIDIPVNKREMEGRRLLGVSRENLRRIFCLCYAYRMTGSKKYSDRAEKEMLAAAEFSDWNPSHFLDVGEMSMALAIGYDWLFDKLSESSRKKIREAIIEKGIKPSYNSEYNGFLNVDHNWNQVCNAGITYGALAIYEDNKDESIKLINRALETIPKAMKQYSPNGAYPEGIGYWGYGTSFNMMFLAAIEKIYKTDFDLNKIEGFMETGMYSQAMITPSYRSFNYSDNGAGAGFNSTVFWFYSKTKNPALLYMQKVTYERNTRKSYLRDRLFPVALIFGAGSGASLSKAAIPTELMWKGHGENPVAVMRSSWGDSTALFLGFKAGSPHVNHGHMDVGSFIFEAEGVNWAFDFGTENYNSLEIKGVSLWDTTEESQRWDVFRYRTTSHNTLSFNDKPQAVNGFADINDVVNNSDVMSVMSDLSELYKKQLPGAKRAVSMVNKKYVVIQDQLKTGDQFTKVRWNILTEADKISFTSDNTAVLEKDGKKLFIKVNSPVPIRFYKQETTPTNTYDSPNKGSMFVGFEADLTLRTTQEISVVLMPGEIVSNPKIPYKF
jgi:Heparinase II/III-like protein.